MNSCVTLVTSGKRKAVLGWNKSNILIFGFFGLFIACNVVYQQSLGNVPFDVQFHQPKYAAGPPGFVISDSPLWAGNLTVYLVDLNPLLQTATLAIDWSPSDNVLAANGGIEKAITFRVGANAVNFPVGARDTSFTRISTPYMMNGLSAYYVRPSFACHVLHVLMLVLQPLDTYHATVEFYTTRADGTSLPFQLSFLSQMKSSFLIAATDATPVEMQSGLYYQIDITCSRPGMFKVYPIFVVVAFWMIIFLEFTVIITMVFFELRKAIEFANVAFFSGLIFALPSFRNSMPLAPPFGVSVDWIAFFWAEAMAVVGLIICGVKYVKDQQAAVKATGIDWLCEVFVPAVPPPPKAAAVAVA